MKVVVAGSSGLIGSALVASLRGSGHEVVRLVRRPSAAPDEFQWDPAGGALAAGVLDGADAVVNLCGVNVGSRRWNGAFKQELRDSRITPTDVLATEVARAGVPVLINASAVGYYGDTGTRTIDETSSPGTDFLAELVSDWEAATAPAAAAGARVVSVRSGLVLSRNGGLLGRLRLIYWLGLGGRLGSGRQYMPWISLEDEIRAITFALENSQVRGPLNSVGPTPCTNAQFTQALAAAMHRPAPWVVPRFALIAVAGEFAKAGLLGGQRAIPAVLEQAGFTFRHNTLGEALAAVLE